MYPEIMIAPMREELTSVGVQELRTAEEVDRTFPPARHGDGGGEFHLRMRGGRMRPAVRAALQNASRPDKSFFGLRRAGYGSDGARSQLLHGIPAILAVHRYSARWKVALHDAAQRHRAQRPRCHRLRAEESV